MNEQWKDREARLSRLPCACLDAHGVPRYDLAHPETIPLPAPFTQAGRIFYDVAEDTLYLGGYTAEEPHEGREWKQFGRVVCAYPRWSAGNRTASLRLVLPYTAASHHSFSAQNLWVAGDYVFVSISVTAEVIAYDGAAASAGSCSRLAPKSAAAAASSTCPMASTPSFAATASTSSWSSLTTRRKS